MIGTLLKLSWTNLARDRVAQVLTFVLPVIFFSIFAYVFGQQERAATSRIEVALVDEDQSETSKRIFETLARDHKTLDVRLTHPREDGVPITRAIAERMIQEGRLPAAIVFPKGFGENFGGFVGGGATIDLLADRSNAVAPQLLNGLLQKTAMTAAPDLMINSGLKMFSKYAGGLTEQQQAAMDLFLPRLRALTAGDATSLPASNSATSDHDEDKDAAGAFSGMIAVNTIDVLNDKRGVENSPAIAFYAAGTAVMFLLFSAAGAGGTLLEEQENGTIDRLLSSQLGMTQLLLGKWVFLAIMGFAQVTVMFVWGWLVFGLQLFTPLHMSGFVVMTTFTAAAAAAFGLLLATVSRSRAQLSGLSTTVILIMSALGGSMFPRFLMPETMKNVGLFTFNAWALDGYQKVFWYNRTIPELWQQVSVLAAITIVFLIAARLVARRWEAV